MNVLSLFDGISCGKLALERAGISVNQYFASEIDEAAIAISKKNHPDIVQLGDITNWKSWKLPKIDLIIAGSPCQGFSRAGKRENFKDPRSGLIFVFFDILEYVRAVNPDVKFLLENVKMKNEWRDVITERLGVEPTDINSKLLSGQNRLRTYWTNIPGVEQPEDSGIRLADILENPEMDYIAAPDGIKFDPTISEQSRALVNRVGEEVRVTQTTRQGYILAQDGDGINLAFPTSKNRRGRVIKQKSSTVDCVCNICVFKDGIIRRFTQRELERLQTLPDGYTDGFSKGVAQKAIGNGWTVDVIAHILRGLEQCKPEQRPSQYPRQ